MKAAIISDTLPGYHTLWSGAELIAVTLHDMLRESGVDPFFITSTFNAHGERPPHAVMQVPTPLKKYEAVLGNFPLDLKAMAGIHAILKRHRPDIVHLNCKYLYLPAIIVCRWLRIPVVSTVADYFLFCPRTFIRKPDGADCVSYHGADCFACVGEMKEGAMKKIVAGIPPFLIKTLFICRKLLFNRYNKKVAAYIALSEKSKARLVRYGIPPDKVRVIYHYFLKEPRRTRDTIEPVSVVFTGWLSRENGTDVLVQAFLEVLSAIPHAKLYLVGTGKEGFVAGLQQTIAARRAEDRVVFLGKKDNAEALWIMSQCGVVVVPHQWPKEFGPVVLIEAAALGKPVITGRIGATEEFVADTVNGFLIDDYRNPPAFAEKITFLLSHPDTARAMGSKGKDTVPFIFNNANGKAMAALYKSLQR